MYIPFIRAVDSTSSVRPVPFNTGKVLIGSRYERPVRITYSRLEERLQASLLKKPQACSHKAPDLALYAVAVLGFVVVLATL